MNKMLTQQELREAITHAVDQCAAREGVTSDEWYAMLRNEWNEAIKRDEEE
jgi:hypothetical protein